MGDKFIIETNDAEEAAKFGDSLWGVDVADTLYFVVGHANAFSAFYGISEKVALFTEPFALMGFETKSVFLEGLEDLEDFGFVVFEGS